MTSGTITIVGHVAHAWLLIAPTAATSHMTTADSYYCGACGTRVGATSVHCSDGPFDISESLLLPSTMATGHLTSAVIATVGHMACTRLLLAPIATAGCRTSLACHH
jgi:hypothetical protein